MHRKSYKYRQRRRLRAEEHARLMREIERLRADFREHTLTRFPGNVHLEQVDVSAFTQHASAFFIPPEYAIEIQFPKPDTSIYEETIRKADTALTLALMCTHPGL